MYTHSAAFALFSAAASRFCFSCTLARICDQIFASVRSTDFSTSLKISAVDSETIDSNQLLIFWQCSIQNCCIPQMIQQLQLWYKCKIL